MRAPVRRDRELRPVRIPFVIRSFPLLAQRHAQLEMCNRVVGRELTPREMRNRAIDISSLEQPES